MGMLHYFIIGTTHGSMHEARKGVNQEVDEIRHVKNKKGIQRMYSNHFCPMEGTGIQLLHRSSSMGFCSIDAKFDSIHGSLTC